MRIIAPVLLLSLWTASVSADVVIHGVPEEMAQTVRSFLTLGEDCALAPWAVRYRFRNADTEIRQALQTFGYYDPQINKSLSFDKDCWHAEFTINPGQPVRTEDLEIAVEGAGKDDRSFQSVIANAPLKEGHIFDHEVYESFKSSLEHLATQRGYFDASFTRHRVIVSKQDRSARVELTLDTGPRYTFGPVSFENATLTDKLMARYPPFKTGDPYDADKIGDLYDALLESGYFDDVLINTDVREEQKIVAVNVRLTPVDPGRTRIGIGFSTDAGPKTSITYKNQRLNRRGHRIEAHLSASSLKKEVGGIYRIPEANHRKGWTSVYGGFVEEETDTTISRKTTVGLRQLVPRGHGWFETRFIEVINDNFDIAADNSTNFSVVPGISWTHATSSVSRRPRHGHHLDIEFSGTSETLGSTIDYTRAVISGKLLLPLWDRARLITRARVGATLTDNFGQLPPSVRFFAGGDDSVRGYDYKTIGPTDADGNVIGGNRIAEGSLEIDHLVKKNWAVAVFFDAGNATRGTFGPDYAKGAGLGVRWYSPIGPLRVDFATPVDSVKSGIRLHISFGPDI